MGHLINGIFIQFFCCWRDWDPLTCWHYKYKREQLWTWQLHGWTWHHKSQLLCTLNSYASQGFLPFTCGLNFPKQKFRTWIFQLLKSPPTLQWISFSICLQRVSSLPTNTFLHLRFCLLMSVVLRLPHCIHCTWSFLSFNSLTAREKEQDT